MYENRKARRPGPLESLLTREAHNVGQWLVQGGMVRMAANLHHCRPLARVRKPLECYDLTIEDGCVVALRQHERTERNRSAFMHTTIGSPIFPIRYTGGPEKGGAMTIGGMEEMLRSLLTLESLQTMVLRSITQIRLWNGCIARLQEQGIYPAEVLWAKYDVRGFLFSFGIHRGAACRLNDDSPFADILRASDS
jgi:hypothetical protein